MLTILELISSKRSSESSLLVYLDHGCKYRLKIILPDHTNLLFKPEKKASIVYWRFLCINFVINNEISCTGLYNAKHSNSNKIEIDK